MFNDIIIKKEVTKEKRCSTCKYSGSDGYPQLKKDNEKSVKYTKSMFKEPCNKCNKYEYWEVK